MKSLHVETGRHFYGGPQQVLYLLEGLVHRGEDAVLVCPPDSEIADIARQRRLKVIAIPCSGDLDLRFAWRLRQVLGAESPSIVHCHSRRGADFLGGQAAAMAGVPAVVSRRVDNPDSRIAARLRYRRFERIVAISQAIELELERSGVDASRIVRIHSAVDIDRLRQPPDRDELCGAFGLSPADEVIVSAAQLIPRKGQRYLLDALAILRQSRPRIRALLFGRGPEKAALKAQTRELGLNDVVSFCGFRDDLDHWLGGFDLLVHTALAEGLGVIALKAQAAGLPVVAFKAGGLPEIIRHEENGTLVTPGNANGLAEAMAALLDDSDMRGRYALNALENVRKRFSIDAMVEAHQALYRDVVYEQEHRQRSDCGPPGQSRNRQAGRQQPDDCDR